MTEIARRRQQERLSAGQPLDRRAGRAGTSGRTSPVYNPATGQQTGVVDFASVEEVDEAVQAAKAAFPAWRPRRSRDARGAVLPHPRARCTCTARRSRSILDARARQGARRTRWARSTRGLEVIEFCCGLPHC